MVDTGHEFVSPDQLRIGLYVELELGWMAHPFPKGSFKIVSQKQIDTIRGLGLTRVRYVPARSDPVTVDASQAPPEGDAVLQRPSPPPPDAASHEERAAQRRAALLAAQRRSQALCDQMFGEALQQYRAVVELVRSRPLDAAAQCRATVDGLVADLLSQGESSIRLLSEGGGDRAFMHPVNVTVLSLLLGKALGCTGEQLHDLGTAAFLHDIGKVQLPERLRAIDSNFSPAEYKQYQGHVTESVLLGQKLELSGGALGAIAQHHELMDGGGFPLQTRGDAIRLPGRILALVNRFDNMCNPARPGTAATPHEALSTIFSQMKARFDRTVLNAFIRMMGVYPPGSVVQLSDSRYAMVASVNSARPLKPQVIVHDPGVPRGEALILDLEQADTPGIRRSLKPATLPRATIDYLAPRARVCYFFERALEPGPHEVE